MNGEALGLFTLMFLVPGALLILFLYLIWLGGTRWDPLEEALIRQYGKRKGRIVAAILFALALLGIWGILYLRLEWVYDLSRGLK